ncbi:hypothetical protein BDZ94DRAFT_1325651 [Collybia nuda]|uniref:DUF6532 domain-containing protein n=1 Tax=Collybia nuda TaxID=64659 RepID=A0A9P6CAG3_9AGAR|nr:hypothetical protein BDZ94DRAFT_1325651 [Collybia nuda]
MSTPNTDTRTAQEKRADTRARNKAKEAEEAFRLEQETLGGRSTKRQALQNAIWNNNGGRKRAASTIAPPTAKKSKALQEKEKDNSAHGQGGSVNRHKPQEPLGQWQAAGNKSRIRSSQHERGQLNPQDGYHKQRHPERNHHTKYTANEHIDIDCWERPRQQLQIHVAPAVPRGEETLPPRLGSKISRRVVQSESEAEESGDDSDDNSRQNVMGDDQDDQDDDEAFRGEINEAVERPVWKARGDNLGEMDNWNQALINHEDYATTVNVDTPISDQEGIEDDTNTEPALPPTHRHIKWKSNTKATLGKRQKAQKAEQPVWGSQLCRAILDINSSTNQLGSEISGATNDSDGDTNNGNNNTSDTEPVWHASTHLVYEDGKRYINLKPQNPKIKSVIEEGFEGAFRYALFENMFPAPDDIDIIFRTLLWKAAKSVNASGIAHRLKYDVVYGDTVGQLARARFLTVRTDLRRHTREHISAEYGLGRGCAEKVKALLMDDNFIYKRDARGIAMNKKPYQHDAIILVLKWFFEDWTSIGRKNIKLFETSIPDNPHYREPEVTIPMVAGSTTMVYADILERSTGEHVKTKFDADTQFGTYQHHCSILEGIKAKDPIKFHRLMSNLFLEATAEKKRDVPKLDNNRTLALIDFDGMSD